MKIADKELYRTNEECMNCTGKPAYEDDGGIFILCRDCWQEELARQNDPTLCFVCRTKKAVHTGADGFGGKAGYCERCWALPYVKENQSPQV